MPKLGKSDLWVSNNIIFSLAKPKLVYCLWLQSFMLLLSLPYTKTWCRIATIMIQWQLNGKDHLLCRKLIIFHGVQPYTPQKLKSQPRWLVVNSCWLQLLEKKMSTRFKRFISVATSKIRGQLGPWWLPGGTQPITQENDHDDCQEHKKITMATTMAKRSTTKNTRRWLGPQQ
jgi:hypothetical protein